MKPNKRNYLVVLLLPASCQKKALKGYDDSVIDREEFMISEGAPYIIKGLPIGQLNIQLELVGADGNLVSDSFNKVKRIATLKPYVFNSYFKIPLII
ncbi:MAG: hypothetical protein ABJN95_16565 [Maribacter sp.]|uniref:hypothetical protein n=1 Tax=Maribacter sp. TaxID=1897614 RepID=UPI003299D875